MESQSSPQLTNHSANAVRYKILTRILPLIEHDIVGVLSVAKMQITVSQRRVMQANGEIQSSLAALEALSTHINKSVQTTRTLSLWREYRNKPPVLALDEIFNHCIHLSRNRMTNLPFSVTYEPTEGKFDQVIAQADLHYLLLGALFYAQDKAIPAQNIAIALGHTPILHIQLHMAGGDDEHNDLPPLTLDEPAAPFIYEDLIDLANALKWQVESESDYLRLIPPPIESAPS